VGGLLAYRPQEAMEHIAATRLLQLCKEGVIQNEEEARHLKECPDCMALLRAFAEERGKKAK
jgi:hypothetical protein